MFAPIYSPFALTARVGASLHSTAGRREPPLLRMTADEPQQPQRTAPTSMTEAQQQLPSSEHMALMERLACDEVECWAEACEEEDDECWTFEAALEELLDAGLLESNAGDL